MPNSSPNTLRSVACLLCIAVLSACSGAASRRSPLHVPGPSAPVDASTGPLELQPPFGDAHRRLQRAIAAMDEGHLAQAQSTLTELNAQFPHNAVILHELALAYRLMREPNKAIQLLDPYRRWLPAESLANLGSALDEAGDRKRAEAVLRAGIAQFPNSGLLYSELGTLLASGGQPTLAVESYEQGIQIDPHAPANYFNAAQLLANGPRRGMALIYGEVFRLLEPDSPRSEHMAELMFNLCRSAVRFETRGSETHAVVSLAPNDLQIDESTDRTQLPFENGFEVVFGTSLVVVRGQGFSLQSLHEARKMSVELLHKPDAPTKLLAHPLMRWLMALEAAGHLEAYDAWLFGPGAPEEFKAWLHRAEARGRLQAMAQYVLAHPLFPKAAENNPDTI